MLTENQKTGKLGEQIAAEYLASKGYRILESNWRFGKAEIDIIAMKAKVLVFIEVKTRTSENYGKPEDFVSEHQQQLITQAASIYMNQIDHQWEVRFDIIGLLVTSEAKLIRLDHLEDAYFPGLTDI